MKYTQQLLFAMVMVVQGCAQQQGFSIPFELIDNRPFISVQVNGKTCHFIFDTGALNAIDKDAADLLGLNLTNPQQQYHVGDNTSTSWTTIVDSLVVEQRVMTSLSLNVVSLRSIREALKLPYLDGIIGYLFMRDYVVQIDYPAKEIRLLHQYSGKHPIPFQLYMSQIPFLIAKVNSMNANLIIDTGDRSSLTLFQHYAKKNKLVSNGDTTITGYGIGGPVWAQQFELRELKVGNSVFNMVMSRIPAAKAGAFARDDMDGSIGSALLKNNVLTIDYPQGLLYLE